jgi:penicillin amidase
LELRFTRHGPVIHEDIKRNRAYALRWAGSEPGGAAYLPSLALDRVQSAKEFVAALSRWKLPSLNHVHADVDGNIGWVAAAATPIRAGWDGLLPVPGKDHNWTGFRAVKDLPQEHNPARHYLVTANHNIIPPGYPHEVAYEWALPYRYLRLKERLDAKKAFTIDDSKSMHYDSMSIPGRRLAGLARSMDARDSELAPYILLMRQWDGELSIDSRFGVIYGFWLQELLDAFFRPHVPANLLEFARGRHGTEVMLAALEKPDEFWFGKDPALGAQRLLRSTLASAIPRIKKTLGANEKEWTWGRLHTVTLRHPLATLGPAYEKAFNLSPVPRPGDGFTPHAAAHNAKFEQLTGASYRHIFDLADWDQGVVTSVPGQSGQPGSLHYADLLPLWAKGEYFPLAFSRKKVEEVTAHRLMLMPVGK